VAEDEDPSVSATGRSDVRHPDDFYSTPGWCVRAILPHLQPVSAFTLDPCAGDGAILREINHGIGLEINRDRAAQCEGIYLRNALSPEPWPACRQVITNPPYNLAMQFVVRALKECDGEIAMLLRLNWLGSQKRAAFHRSRPSDVFILPRRPSFTGDGRADATEYAWFVWGLNRGGRWAILETETMPRKRDSGVARGRMSRGAPALQVAEAHKE
jgi:hypothetical protein